MNINSPNTYIKKISFKNDAEHKNLNLVKKILQDGGYLVAKKDDSVFVQKHTQKQLYLNELHLRCLLDDRRETYGNEVPTPDVVLYDKEYTTEPEIQTLFEKAAEKLAEKKTE